MLLACPEHPALCVLLPTFLIPSKLLSSYPIPGLPISYYPGSHFQGRVKALSVCQQFLAVMKCQGVKPSKWRAFCHLAGAFHKQLSVSLTVSWASPSRQNLTPAVTFIIIVPMLQTIPLVLEIQTFKIMWLHVCGLACKCIYVAIWHNGRKEMEKFLGQQLFRQELSLKFVAKWQEKRTLCFLVLSI